MQKTNLTAFERELADVLLDSINVYPARELEDTLFEVFEDAYTEDLEDLDIDKRKFLHALLRRFFRTLDQNPDETKILENTLCKTLLGI